MARQFAHAPALDGYRVLCVAFDPQPKLSHSMGLTDFSEEHGPGYYNPRLGA